MWQRSEITIVKQPLTSGWKRYEQEGFTKETHFLLNLFMHKEYIMINVLATGKVGEPLASLKDF